LELPITVFDEAGASAEGVIRLTVIETVSDTEEVLPESPGSELTQTNSEPDLGAANEEPATEDNEPLVSLSVVDSGGSQFMDTSQLGGSINLVSNNSLNNSTTFNSGSTASQNSDSEDSGAEDESVVADESLTRDGDFDSNGRLEEVSLRLANTANQMSKGLLSLSLNNGHRIVVELLLDSLEEASAELQMLGSMFVNQNAELAFSPHLINALQGVTDDLAEGAASSEDQLTFQVNSITFVSAGLTIGFVTWLLQSGSLVATAVTSAPLWQSIDPVPVLSSSDSDSAS